MGDRTVLDDTYVVIYNEILFIGQMLKVLSLMDIDSFLLFGGYIYIK